MMHSKKSYKSPESDPKETQAMYLADKDFTTTFLNMLKEVKYNMDRN